MFDLLWQIGWKILPSTLFLDSARIRLEPGHSRWQMEQQHQQSALSESQQEYAVESQQQSWVRLANAMHCQVVLSTDYASEPAWPRAVCQNRLLPVK